MSSLRVLRTFVTIARLGSFSEAAEFIGLTQAAVSLQMRSLEREFNRELFDRSNSRPAWFSRARRPYGVEMG